MGRSGHHHRTLISAALILSVTGTGPSCNCSDRVLGEEPADGSEPACLWLINPRGFRADGSSSLIQDHVNQRNGTVCLCITEDEYDALGERLSRVGFPESGTLLEEFNELAYEECKRLSDLDEDEFVDDECLDYYEAGEWLKDIYLARGDWANGTPPGFYCPPEP